MRRLWPILLLLIGACSGSGDSSNYAGTGVRLTIEYESLLDLRTLDVFGQFADGTTLDKATFPVPLSVDPPGIREFEVVVGVETPGPLSLRADGLDPDGKILGSGRVDVTIVAGELAPVRVVLGTPVVCGDGNFVGGTEQCDDGNQTAGDGCSPTCAIEPGWQCANGSLCTKCGNGRVEPGEMCDDNNAISGDGCSDRCVIEGEINHTFEIEQLETQTTTSADWVIIPGTTLVFTPNRPMETWAVFASGKLRSTDPTEITAEMRLTIDGVESTMFGHQTMGTTNNWAGFITFDRVDSKDSPIQVALEFRAELGTTEADDLRVVAARVPASADFQFFEDDDVTELTGDRLDLGTLAFTPSFAGDYFVFAELSQTELPGVDTARAYLQDETGARHPNDRNGSGFSNGRANWAPMFVAFEQNLDVRPHAFTLRGGSSGVGTTTNWWDLAWDHRRPITVASTGTVSPAGYSIPVTFDHAAMVAAGMSNADGSDVRVVFDGTELDRILDPDSSWNQPDTTIWFSTVNQLDLDSSDVYHLYFGNPDAGPPPEDPALVFLFFDGFDAAQLDPNDWTVENGTAELNGGELTVGPGVRVRQLGGYLENTIWEVRSRLSTPVGNRMTWLGGSGQGGTMSWFSDDSDHHAETNGVLTHFTADTPTSFHVWRIARESGAAVHFAQDDTLIASHDTDLPVGRLQPRLANETQGSEITYDWLRIRSFVFPEPGVTFADVESIRAGAPSGWAFRKIMAFRADAFEATQYAESLGAETTTSTIFQPKAELESEAPPDARDYLSIQSVRISGISSADARRSGELRAGGETLLATSHKITRTSEDVNGYHHVAGAVDLRRADAPVRYQNGFRSPDGISVRAAESVIILLRFPPSPH